MTKFLILIIFMKKRNFIQKIEIKPMSYSKLSRIQEIDLSKEPKKMLDELAKKSKYILPFEVMQITK